MDRNDGRPGRRNSGSFNRVGSPIAPSPNLNVRGLQNPALNDENGSKGSSLSSPLLDPTASNDKRKPSESDLTSIQSSAVSAIQTPLLSKEQSRSIMDGYLWGQIGNVAKMGVWWTVFGPLVATLVGPLGIGLSRFSFNFAMLIFSPIAGALAEHSSVRQILIRTSFLRMLIYSIFIPASWFFLKSGWLVQADDWMSTFFLVVFMAFVFLDGVAVAFANVVDIDCGGTDLVAGQYGTIVDEQLRNRFNSLHEGFFDASMIILSPVVALGGLITAKHITANFADEAAVVGAMGVLFLFTSLFSLYNYGLYLPSKTARPVESVGCAQLRQVFGNVCDGFKLCMKTPVIRWRLLFLALETSFEDAVISLVISQFAIEGIEEKKDNAMGTFWAATIVAVGKFGGVISAVLMHKYWKAPTSKSDSSAFRPLFGYVFVSALCSALLPAAYYFMVHGDNRVLGLGLLYGGSFLYFLFSTAPKIGFATLLQGMAAEMDASGRIFGFVAAFLTTMDSLIMLGLGFVFQYLSLEHALMVTSGLIVLHGLLEMIAGPYLILGGN